jgi:hypothetical protein
VHRRPAGLRNGRPLLCTAAPPNAHLGSAAVEAVPPPYLPQVQQVQALRAQAEELAARYAAESASLSEKAAEMSGLREELRSVRDECARPPLCLLLLAPQILLTPGCTLWEVIHTRADG